MVNITYGPKIDYRHCNGCRQCYDYCPLDIFGWDEEKGMPVVAYPGECRFCCICELDCLQKAINVELPLHSKIDLAIYSDVK